MLARCPTCMNEFDLPASGHIRYNPEELIKCPLCNADHMRQSVMYEPVPFIVHLGTVILQRGEQSWPYMQVGDCFKPVSGRIPDGFPMSMVPNEVTFDLRS